MKRRVFRYSALALLLVANPAMLTFLGSGSWRFGLSDPTFAVPLVLIVTTIPLSFVSVPYNRSVQE